ncbi:DUF1048 domain-containing protein [Leifsonia shinshuensis]|uniref:DUF1048 domain-containing protein n=1 Tax=Leifsonia shinshuensis TaxID=150026 RepID=UPI001F513F27|nr:DUF1048 domain-containing protein [Leifsonia shinshuensis]MCI0156285.1 DUF1048 domain-containing protein [Leifsonia shinshuensis]
MPSTSEPDAGKRRRRERNAQAHRLPEPYDTTMRAVVRYATKTGPGDGGQRLRMVDDLAELFEQGAADRTSLTDLLGDPVEFADAFKANYGAQSRILREQRRLIRTIAVFDSEL